MHINIPKTIAKVMFTSNSKRAHKIKLISGKEKSHIWLLEGHYYQSQQKMARVLLIDVVKAANQR